MRINILAGTLLDFDAHFDMKINPHKTLEKEAYYTAYSPNNKYTNTGNMYYYGANLSDH